MKYIMRIYLGHKSGYIQHGCNLRDKSRRPIEMSKVRARVHEAGVLF